MMCSDSDGGKMALGTELLSLKPVALTYFSPMASFDDSDDSSINSSSSLLHENRRVTPCTSSPPRPFPDSDDSFIPSPFLDRRRKNSPYTNCSKRIKLDTKTVDSSADSSDSSNSHNHSFYKRKKNITWPRWTEEFYEDFTSLMNSALLWGKSVGIHSFTVLRSDFFKENIN